MAEPSVAACITGQLRTLASHGLHVAIRNNVLRQLPADAFLHVDVSDTRSLSPPHTVAATAAAD